MSFTRAAEDLHLSQSALSRQVQGLEEEVGRPLFLRNARRVNLTQAGEELARAARIGLKAIDDCVLQLQTADARSSVSVTTFGSFASLWLIPRLPAFAASHPDVDVNCIASDRAMDLDKEDVDVALRAMSRRLPESEGQLLFEEIIVPVCGAGMAESGRVPRNVPDLANHTLLKLEEAFERQFPWFSWDHWLEQAGFGELKPRATLRFTNFDQVIQATLSGQGVALARAALIAELLQERRLLTPLGSSRQPESGYYLLAAKASVQRPAVRDFVRWIGDEAAKTRALLKRVMQLNPRQRARPGGR